MNCLVTGVNGLIGKSLATRLRLEGHSVIGVDNGADVEIADLFRWLSFNHEDVGFCIHLGANTNTLEMDKSIFQKYNYGYSESLWYKCARHRIPLIYASSAATYGAGEKGYSDETHPNELTPLNPYGVSKNEFDKFVLSHNHINDAPFWAGLKFFNVYGYDESHKGKMASMIYHAYNQIKEVGSVRLFIDGWQKRDFVYVEDLVDTILWMMNSKVKSGIYNVGTGQGRTFNDMVRCIFGSLNQPSEIKYFEMPESMKNKYQSYTQADIQKLRKAGYERPFTTLENGIEQYIKKLENAESPLPSLSK